MSVATQSLDMFGQVVIGPPGSGKTTYCAVMQEFLRRMGRNVVVINLDPANDVLPYDCGVDVKELITLDEVMQSLDLGPNGGLLYCMDYLYKNRFWLANHLLRLRQQQSNRVYVIFDCPGQVEAYGIDSAFRKLLAYLTNPQRPSALPRTRGLAQLTGPPATTAGANSSNPDEAYQGLASLGLRLASVHLVDSHYCSDAGKFISVLLTSLMTMLQLGLPHVNVLSKVDLVEQYGPLPFNLDFFTEVLDLSRLVEQLEDDAFYARYKKLNKALADLVQDCSLITFQILDAQNHDLLERVLHFVDKANGYVFGKDEHRTLQSMMSCAAGAESSTDFACMAQERYTGMSKR